MQSLKLVLSSAIIYLLINYVSSVVFLSANTPTNIFLPFMAGIGFISRLNNLWVICNPFYLHETTINMNQHLCIKFLEVKLIIIWYIIYFKLNLGFRQKSMFRRKYMRNIILFIYLMNKCKYWEQLVSDHFLLL